LTTRGQDEVLTNKVANSAAPRGVSGTRVERWHGLAEELVMAFAMGTHARLGRAWACQAAGAGGGRGGCRARPRREERTTGERPYFMMPVDLVKRVVEACRWKEEGKECCS